VTKGARVVFSTGRTGKAKHAAAMRRLGLALGVLDAAWPEAARETRARTRLVLPLDEPGLVSFSMASRPGVSYINLRGKSVLDLADDLLHETAHHRLHTIESRVRLFVRTVPDSPGGGDLRYWSPWRRSASRPRDLPLVLHVRLSRGASRADRPDCRARRRPRGSPAHRHGAVARAERRGAGGAPPDRSLSSRSPRCGVARRPDEGRAETRRPDRAIAVRGDSAR
jgi:hypothetical protein